MNVADLAKELKISTDELLKALRSLKLKAKDGKQEISSAVASVVRGELARIKKAPATVPAKPAESAKEKVPAVKAKVEKKEEAKPKAPPQPAAKEEKKLKPVKEEAHKHKTIIKKRIVKKETAVKPKGKFSSEPVITLKPLSRKRRRSSGKSDKHFEPFGETKEGESNAALAESALGTHAQPTTGQPRAEMDGVTATEAQPEPLMPRDPSLPDMEIKVPISVKDFSVKLQQKPSVVLKYLMKFGILAHINQNLDGDVVSKIAQEFGYNYVKIRTQEEHLVETHKQEEEDPSLLSVRAPVVTFMGHVDHGKTSLLDRLRKSNIADKEHGGITQHIGAYSVITDKGKITFLDTPGHEAFTSMRARGAHITDLVVLVVAADEGVMPQTEEAIAHARAAEVPIVVALNKIDKPNANPDLVKKELMERNLVSEDWGGKTVVASVSAKTGQGIKELLEMIILEAELLELKANAQKKASGIVVEAHLSQGKGVVATLIVQSGTLKEGDYIVVGPHYGKVRAMFDDHERLIKEAGPSTPVAVLGLPDVPPAGEMFYIVDDEKHARAITFKRQEEIKNKKLSSQQRITLEDLYSKIQEGSIKELNVILKADVQGSLEALKDSLGKIPSNKVKIKFIHSGVGDVSASDVVLALASKAIIIAFHVGISQRAKEELEKDPVDIRQYRIIYDAVDDIKNALEGMLEAKTKKKLISRIEVRQVFKLSKHGTIAGCYVTQGKVNRKAKVDVLREGAAIYSGSISSLKRFKDDVREVTEGMECGIALEGFDKYATGDVIEAYELESIAQKL